MITPREWNNEVRPIACDLRLEFRNDRELRATYEELDERRGRRVISGCFGIPEPRPTEDRLIRLQTVARSCLNCEGSPTNANCSIGKALIEAELKSPIVSALREAAAGTAHVHQFTLSDKVAVREADHRAVITDTNPIVLEDILQDGTESEGAVVITYDGIMSPEACIDAADAIEAGTLDASWISDSRRN